VDWGRVPRALLRDLSDGRVLAQVDLLGDLAELLGEFTLHAVLDGVEDRVDGGHGLVRRLGAFLVDACPHEDRVPRVLGLFVKLVRTADVRLGRVADKVDCLRRTVDVVFVLAPLLEEACGELKGADLRLAKGDSLELLTLGQIGKEDLDHLAEGAHAETDIVVFGRPDNIVVGKVDRWAFVKGLGEGTNIAILGHGQVEHNLDIASPVSAVSKDEDSLDLDLGEVTVSSGVLELICGQLSERSSGGVVLDNVSWSHDILEAVTFSHLATLLTLATNDKDRPILGNHFLHRSMTTDELRRGDFNVKLAGQIDASLGLCFSTTVREKDIWSEKV
jgi:hypothetical protein